MPASRRSVSVSLLSLVSCIAVVIFQQLAAAAALTVCLHGLAPGGTSLLSLHSLPSLLSLRSPLSSLCRCPASLIPSTECVSFGRATADASARCAAANASTPCSSYATAHLVSALRMPPYAALSSVSRRYCVCTSCSKLFCPAAYLTISWKELSSSPSLSMIVASGASICLGLFPPRCTDFVGDYS